ncbi:hypothetical protein WN944_016344 [Citrus x changshan-huyou]|uniref:Uncharacterized protein n=1 Tax=Citrus x changshan-huyou TaxID=2935761 RepID=A0AAP0M964_9ROSI
MAPRRKSSPLIRVAGHLYYPLTHDCVTDPTVVVEESNLIIPIEYKSHRERRMPWFSSFPNVHSYTVLIAALYKQVVALARGWRIQLALMSLAAHDRFDGFEMVQRVGVWRGHDAPTASSNQTLRHDSAFIKPRCMASKPGP